MVYKNDHNKGGDGGYEVDKIGKVIHARIMVDIVDSKWKDINGVRYGMRHFLQPLNIILILISTV